MKRLVVGVFVSAVAVVGAVPVASAASASDSSTVVAKVKKPTAPKIIDWDAPAPVSGGGYSAQRIDWD
jgi:predicted RNA binding protein with dsRBD fold (UPF0201 family)